MKRIGFFALFLGLLACSDASGHAPKQEVQAGTLAEAQAVKVDQLIAGWTVDKTKSTLSFSGTQNNEIVIVSFESFDPVIQFDPEQISNAHVVVTIDMNSANADDDEITNALPSKDWFYARKFPLAKFEASDFKSVEGDNYETKGVLTVRGITQAIALPFSLKIENDHATMDAKITLNRTAYKIGTGMWADEGRAGHEVAINIHLEANKNK